MNSTRWIVASLIILYSCNRNDKLFHYLSEDKTGITFSNTITISDSVNGVTFDYIYNGGGVAAGDVNNDGKPDLFFGGNMVSSRLYLNDGDFHFRDITAMAGSGTNAWCTGISMVDINNDGWLDIYICVAGYKGNRKNIFFINQGADSHGIPHFIDEAARMGVDDAGYSTMAAFADFDKDGDLDLYVLTNAIEKHDRNALRERKVNGESESNDRLYRNNGDGTFTNITRQAGILQEGYGLGLNVSDLNMDGWPDIYCSDDFLSNDLLWISQKDGTFKDMSGKYFKHFTLNGMGMDIADYNNDGLPDVFVLDMLPFTNERIKNMIVNRSFNNFYKGLALGYHPQFLRNTLQLNMGMLGDTTYHFSEIGYLANMYQTDWSWAPLLADFNNDGLKDLFIANGYRKDVTNLDYITYDLQNNSMFGTPDALEEKAFREMQDLPDVKLTDFIFENNDSLRFQDVSRKWGIDMPTFANGAVYCDLDQDGDLDLILNTMDEPAHIYENLLYDHNRQKTVHFLDIKLRSVSNTSRAYNTKAWCYTGGKLQYIENTPYQGYRSTVGSLLHFGLGNFTTVDSVCVYWSDGKVSRFSNVAADQVLTVNHDSAASIENWPGFFRSRSINHSNPDVKFMDQHNVKGLNYTDTETSGNDIDQTPTLLHQLSRYGPGIAAGDINGDSLEDFVIGGDSHKPAMIFFQTAQGDFIQKAFDMDSDYEDLGCLLFDADNDGDNDLYMVSGGSGHGPVSAFYQDRLYLNDGKGNFSRPDGLLPEIQYSGSVVTACDFDQDGDLDLFRGSRLIPSQYPYAPKSYLLENSGGKFTDISATVPRLDSLGMITSALWSDFNNDGFADLIVTGEWMPVTVLENKNGKFVDVSKNLGLENTDGWYNSVSGADLNNDGYTDYIFGNTGLNSYFKPTVDQPVEIYAKDMDHNGTIDPVMTNYILGKKYITHSFTAMFRQVPGMKARFRLYSTFGSSTFDESFLPEDLKGALHLSCYQLASTILINDKGTVFTEKELPLQAQFSNIYGIQSADLNSDHYIDLITIGNSYSEETITGWYDASWGNVLLGNGHFGFQIPAAAVTGFIVDDDAKALTQVHLKNGENMIVATQNNGPVKSYIPQEKTPSEMIRLENTDWFSLIDFGDGVRKQEFYYGEGYLSQKGRWFQIPAGARKVTIVTYSGQRRNIR